MRGSDDGLWYYQYSISREETETYKIESSQIVIFEYWDTYHFYARRWRWYHDLFYKKEQRMNMYLFFVTEPDTVVKGKTVEGEPLLASAGKDAEDSWVMLTANRERATGMKQNRETIKAELTARGCVVHKYLVKPLDA